MTLLARRPCLAVLEIASREIQTWEDYEWVHDLLVPGGAFTFRLPLMGSAERRLQVVDLFRQSDLSVRGYLARDPDHPSERALQLTGRLKKLAVQGERQGTTLTVQGNDRGSELAGASCDPRVTVTAETVFVDVVRELCRPFGIEVEADGVRARLIASGATVTRTRGEVRRAYSRALGVPGSEVDDVMVDRLLAGEGGGFALAATRAEDRARRGHGNGRTASDVSALKLEDAKPGVGETVWEYIDRHARRFGVLPWMSPQGKLILAAPDYDQEPSYTLTRRLRNPEANSIVSGGVVYDYSSATSEVTVFGRTRSHDATRSRFVATAVADMLPDGIHRPLYIHDPSVRSQEEAARRALREQARQRENFEVLEYEVRDHGNDHRYFAIDTIADVDDEELGIRGEWYVVSRAFKKSRKEGTTTRLRLVPKGAITP